MTVLGVIGPIASGKSFVLEALARLGAATLQADDASRALLQPGGPELQAVVEAFGTGILEADGGLNRRALGDRIFADAQARERLEAILHPAMVEWLRGEIARLGNTRPAPVVIALEAAILERMGARPLCDRTLLVTAAREVRRARLIAKGLSPVQAEARVAVQDQMVLEGPADYVIDTTCSPAQTRARVASLWRRLTRPDAVVTSEHNS
jgi:dephospho-CoA kinase